jgi:hypothetical protein
MLNSSLIFSRKVNFIGYFTEYIHKLNNIVCISTKKLDSHYMVC